MNKFLLLILFVPIFLITGSCGYYDSDDEFVKVRILGQRQDPNGFRSIIPGAGYMIPSPSCGASVIDKRKCCIICIGIIE